MVNAAHSGRPATGVRFLFGLEDDSDDEVTYQGTIAVAAAEFVVCVRVRFRVEGKRGDEFYAEASAPALPVSERGALEKLAARLVLPVVRRARRAGIPPPRNIRRWRKNPPGA